MIRQMLIALIALLFISCNSHMFHLIKNEHKTPPTINNNVCKTLNGEVLVYAVFVDTRNNGKWSIQDINTTLDSLQIAMDWIKTKAETDSIELNIRIANFQTEKYTPIRKNFTNHTVTESSDNNGGVKNLNRWADKVTKYVSRNISSDTPSLNHLTKKLKGRAKLIAQLRNKYGIDNIAIIYFVKDVNHKENTSIAMNIGSAEEDEIEYAVLTNSLPSVIAHEFLHLFGAIDLYITKYDKKRRIKKRKQYAMRLFPNEIMAFGFNDIKTLEISPLTKYLIGWSNDLAPLYKKKFIERRTNLVYN